MSIVLKVQGMSCGHCVSTITTVVSPLPGVSAVDVDLADGQATVDGTPDSAAVIAAIEDAGYDVSPAVSA
jgi:copper chaperone